MRFFLKKVRRGFDYAYCICRKKLVELKLKNTNQIAYRNDWVSHNYFDWEKWFASYVGKENVCYLEVALYVQFDT
jgi:hypothetical protein